MVTAITNTALLRSFAHRAFFLLWSGQALSRVGDHLYQVALAWWVLEKTGSATAMATVLIFSFTPMLLFLLIGGVAVDRYPRVQVMLASDLARGAVMILVAGFAFLDRLEIWHVYLASLVFGLVDAFFQPAYTAAVPDIVPEADLPSANSLSSMSMQAGRIAGPALGAAVVSVGGTAWAFGLNAITFFASAAFLVPLLGLPAFHRAGSVSQQPSSILTDFREGISTVVASPWLWITIAVFALSNVTLSGPYSVALPFLVKDHLHADVSTLGLLYAIFAIGYVVGGVWALIVVTIYGRWVLSPDTHAPIRLTVYAFSTQEEVLTQQIFPAFEEAWEAETGRDLIVEGMFGPSATLARQIVLGAPADVALLSNEQHVNWLKVGRRVRREAQPDVVSWTPMVIVTRPGNPGGIAGFDDLAQPGLQLLHADPRSSGAGDWAVLSTAVLCWNPGTRRQRFDPTS